MISWTRTPIIIDITEQTIDTFEYCEAALVSPVLEACILCSGITRNIANTATILQLKQICLQWVFYMVISTVNPQLSEPHLSAIVKTIQDIN